MKTYKVDRYKENPVWQKLLDEDCLPDTEANITTPKCREEEPRAFFNGIFIGEII